MFQGVSYLLYFRVCAILRISGCQLSLVFKGVCYPWYLRVSAILGAVVADSASLNLDWIYDDQKMKVTTKLLDF